MPIYKYLKRISLSPSFEAILYKYCALAETLGGVVINFVDLTINFVVDLVLGMFGKPIEAVTSTALDD